MYIRNTLVCRLSSNFVYIGLKKRGTAEEAGVDTSVAPAIQGNKNALEYEMKKDKVSQGSE